MEYIVIGILVAVLVGVVTFFLGEKVWGRTCPGIISRSAFSFYRMITRLRISKGYKKIIMLHLMKVGPEITAVTPEVIQAQRIFNATTMTQLVDIYDDGFGHRYIKTYKEEVGTGIFEIMEYMRIALNTKIKEEQISIVKDKKPEFVQELEAKPTLRVISGNNGKK